MKTLHLFFLLFLCLLLSGCAASQVEEQLLVIVMGVDLTDSGDIALTVKVPSNTTGGQDTSSSQEAEKGGNQMGYLTLHALGNHFAQASELLLATTPRSLNFSQVQEIVIGSKLAKSPHFTRILRQVYALPRMRTQALLVMCEEDARGFVEEQKPYIGSRLSQYIEVSIRNYAGKGFVPTTTLSEALREISYGWRDPLLILGALPEKESSKATPGNVLNVDAGELSPTSVNAVKLYGSAATNGISVCGTLTGYETALINLLKGSAQSLALSDEEGYALPVYVRTPATLTVHTDGEMRLGLQLMCEVHYLSDPPPDQHQVALRLQQEITGVIHKLQQMHCDALGFGSIAVRRFFTLPQWENFHFREKYANAAVDVQVQVRLKRE